MENYILSNGVKITVTGCGTFGGSRQDELVKNKNVRHEAASLIRAGLFAYIPIDPV